MPRNSSGTMSLPTPGVPFQSGATISSSQVNATFSDLAAEVTSSLDRAGRGGMTAPLRAIDGTAAAPAYSFSQELGSGWYRAGANDVRATVGGVDALRLAPGGVVGPINMPATAGVFATGTSTTLTLRGNLAAADAGGDVAVSSAVVRTAGFLLDVQNAATGKFQVDYQGLARLVNQAAAIQPASMVTAITPDAGITASAGAAYWKDATGRVQLKGQFVNNTGAATSNWTTTSPLPAGFRPTSLRQFTVLAGGTATILMIGVDGTIKTAASIASGLGVSLDGVSFLAEQ